MKTQLVHHSTNYRNNVHEIITRVWLAETGAFSYNTSANYKQRTRCQNFFIYIINK